tara:strand:+ start:707 stop:943 length:237 start_codon:yes stop_codon:yes gene_type:complete
MSNKSPFELRFDVLKMAKDLMDQQYEIANQQYWTMVNQAEKNSQDVKEVFEKYTPKMYQPQEIMSKAEELYKFVTKKD